MDLSFGARLRLQRERQQVALTAIAERTKIKLSLLEGLERDDVSRWPDGIFRRSYVRVYAEAIGLEPDGVLREFLELYPDPSEHSPAALATPPIAAADPASGRPCTRLGFLLDSALGAVSGRLGLSLRERHGAAPVPAARGGSSGERKAGDPEWHVAEAVVTNVPAAHPNHVPAPTGESPVKATHFSLERDLSAMARLCTRLGRVLDTREMAPLLEDAARILDAVGLIVWIWEPGGLSPALAHGYSDTLLAQLPRLRRSADNPVAGAFRSAETCVVERGDQATGAVVVPLMAPKRCLGVLAIELQHGGEQREAVRALATILAAQLSTVIGPAPMAKPRKRVEAPVSDDRLRRLASARA